MSVGGYNFRPVPILCINYKILWFGGLLALCLIVPSCCCMKSRPVTTQNLSPVILVPGDGGSQIQAKWNKPAVPHLLCTKTQKTWTTLWLVITELSPYIVGCFVDNMKLIYSNSSRTTFNTPGVKTRIPGFGETFPVEYLDPYAPRIILGYFNQVVSNLLTLGYKRDITLKGAPFDFRKAPNELGDFYLNLTRLIEGAFDDHKQRVTLIAHSMGAPVLHHFFSKKSQAWKDKYVQTVISLSGAWAGSVKPIKVYAMGDNLGYRVISASSVRPLQISFPSLAFLMPSREVWAPDEVLVQTPTRNYSLSSIQEYFNAIQFADGFDMYQDTKDLLYKLPPPGVEIHCLHGLGVPTTEKLVYKSSKDFPWSPTLVTGDGDGTVNVRSAEFCLQWTQKQKQKIYHKPFDKVDHMGILSDAAVLQYISKYLHGVSLQNARKASNPLWPAPAEDFPTFPEEDQDQYERAGPELGPEYRNVIKRSWQ